MSKNENEYKAVDEVMEYIKSEFLQKMKGIADKYEMDLIKLMRASLFPLIVVDDVEVYTEFKGVME